MEGENGVEELGLREGLGELREGVGNVESGRERVGEEVGEAEEADGATLLSFEDKCGSVALGACLWWSWRRITVG